MTFVGDTEPRPPRLRRLVIAGVVLGLMLAGLVLLGLAMIDHHRGPTHSAQPTPTRLATPPVTTPSRTAARPSRTPHRTRARRSGRPPRAGAARGRFSAISGSAARLRIPALRINAPIVRTGAVNGSMVIPPDVRQVGWYDGIDVTNGAGSGSGVAPAPGQSGVAILAGHVNWVGQGPGALRYIGELKSGDRIDVVGSNGRVTHWRVTGRPSVTPKSALPPALFTNSGPARLALVTCGGPFDRATGNYADNVIVWAALES